jgi:murein DD-endopeptidase MepM/ murein hydrolase activator NlpD
MPTTPTFHKYQSSQTGEVRARGIIAGSFIILFSVTFIVAAIALTAKPRANEDGRLPVSTAIVFAVPVSQYSSMLKTCSLSELQYNATARYWESHKRVTLEVPLDTPVFATFDGKVSNVTNDYKFGKTIEIDHGNGLKTVYGNLNENTLVRIGDDVIKGKTQIGTVGQTARNEFTTTPHLMVQVLKNGKAIDPNDYIDFPIK